MANPVFPSSLPGPELSSLSWQPLFDNVIRSQMDVGAKSRRRATAVPEVMRCRLWLDAAQLQTLLDFYEVTLKSVLPFDWHEFRKPTDTETLATYTFQKKPNHGPWTHDSYYADLELILHTTFQGTFLLDIDPLTT